MLAKNTFHDPIQRPLGIQGFDIHAHTARVRHRTCHQPFGVGKIEVQARPIRRIGQTRAPFFVLLEDPVLWTTRKIPGKDTTQERMGDPVLKLSLVAKTGMNL